MEQIISTLPPKENLGEGAIQEEVSQKRETATQSQSEEREVPKEDKSQEEYNRENFEQQGSKGE